jgi:acyl-CoA thioesterase II
MRAQCALTWTFMARPQSSTRLQELVKLLDLERIEQNLFRAYHPHGRQGRLYGGQIMAQALKAAISTVEADRPAHSLHGYFLRAGDPAVPALIDVERLRDGRSFTTRRVVVIQHGQAIFNMDVSFQHAEPGLEHQMDMPDLTPPPQRKIPKALTEPPFIAWRHEHKMLKENDPHPPRQHIWFRASGTLPDDPVLHTCMLVYESDNALLSTGRLPHRGSFVRSRMQMASLDHAMWLHQPALTAWRADQWLLYVLDSPSASASRGYNRGLIFTEGGTLVASVMQEGLMRQR